MEVGELELSKEVTYPTTLHCEGCVDNIKYILNQDEGVQEWSVDLEPEVKTLTVKGSNISKDHIDSLLREKGYQIIGFENETQDGFWTDMYSWKRASFNTLNCLIGCSIGDFGMVFFLQAFYPSTPLMIQMILAIIAGLMTSIMLETTILRVRERFSWSLALKTAFGMSFISMVAMEIAMTSTDFMITGGKAAFADPAYWLALFPALVVGFLTPLPYNYYKLRKFNQACH